MKLVPILALLLAGRGLAQTPPSARVGQGGAPPSHGTSLVDVDMLQIPDSLEALYHSAQLIVNGLVVKRLPSRKMGHSPIETSFLVSISDVLKGIPPQPVILVSQFGGEVEGERQILAKDSLMQEGERYVLFLYPDSRRQSPGDTDPNRYTIVGNWIGKARIAGGRAVWNVATPSTIRLSYEDVPLEQLLRDIRNLAQQ